MNTIYILMIVYSVGMGAAATTQEFTTKAKCEAAQAALGKHVGLKSYCVEK